MSLQLCLNRYGGCLWFLSTVQYEYTQSSQKKKKTQKSLPLVSGTVARFSFRAYWITAEGGCESHAQVGKARAVVIAAAAASSLDRGHPVQLKTQRTNQRLLYAVIQCMSDIHWLPPLSFTTRVKVALSKKKIELACTNHKPNNRYFENWREWCLDRENTGNDGAPQTRTVAHTHILIWYIF